MLRARILARLMAGLAGAGLAALTAALALLAVGGPAVAATAAADPPPPVEGSGIVAAAAAPTKITSQYSCDLSGYGTSIPAATLSATLTIPASVVAGSKLDLTLATTASDALPAAVLTALKGVTSFDVSAQLTQQPGTGLDASDPVALGGTAQAPATLTAVPAATATGTAEFDLAGSGVIVAPAQTLTITPHTSAAALAAITCTSTAATQDVKVTATPQTIGTSGPLYACVESVAGTNVDTIDGHIPATITASGTRATGKTDTVTYETSAFGPFTETGAGTSGVSVAVNAAASLPVTGAQSGQISMNQAIDPASAVMKLSGKLALTKAGTDHILVPKTITITIAETSGAVTVTAKLTCTLTTTPTPVGLTISVTKAAGRPSPSTSPTPDPTTTSTQSGIPAGAPDTGGGTGPGVSVGTAAAGGVIAVSGGSLVLVGRRRRRRRG
jgi:hypothetical protein